MSDRVFAIICQNKNNNVLDIISKLPLDAKITVFYKDGIDFSLPDRVSSKKIELSEFTVPKARNLIIRSYIGNPDIRYLHVIEETVDILKDPTEFLTDVESMMDVLDLNVWFNTINDPCNYVYAKYNPRLNVVLDDDKYSLLKLKQILFTSHANTSWTIFDIKHLKDDEYLLPEDYTIAMFYIIEYLAARRNNKNPGEIKYMNQYPTVSSEHKTFGIKKFENQPNDEKQNIEEEDKIFKAKNINFAPDNNIDIILEDIYNKLNSKIGK